MHAPPITTPRRPRFPTGPTLSSTFLQDRRLVPFLVLEILVDSLLLDILHFFGLPRVQILYMKPQPDTKFTIRQKINKLLDHAKLTNPFPS